MKEFLGAIVRGDLAAVSRALRADPSLATSVSDVGATRENAQDFFFSQINHYLYRGDTALHVAAAAFEPRVVRLLLDGGARVRAKNRRGAEPLHYASDTNHWKPEAQAETVQALIRAGADPNAVDRSGVAPLHRAVRTCGPAAVRALLENGADARRPNRAGSTPLHLAVQTTGRGGTGSEESRRARERVVALLLEHGARPTDEDARGRPVFEATRDARLRELLMSATDATT